MQESLWLIQALSHNITLNAASEHNPFKIYSCLMALCSFFFTAIYNFKATQVPQISLQIGDVVHILEDHEGKNIQYFSYCYTFASST